MTEFINGVAQVGGDADVGGLYGINVEQLSGNKTLTPGTDEIYQYLDPWTSNRDVTLDTASATAGDRFVIKNTRNVLQYQYIRVKQGGSTLDTLYSGRTITFIFNGTNWLGMGVGVDDTVYDNADNIAFGKTSTAYSNGIAIGYQTNASTSGIAIGRSALGNNFGVAVGYQAKGTSSAVAVGAYADGATYGVALGYQTDTNTKRYSIALGYYSECERFGETSINIDGNSTQKNNVIQGRWSKTTTNDTPVEMFCAAYGTSRFTIRASSALAFKMTIVARDNVANEVAMYTFEGVIKRDASNNTVMSIINKAIIYEDDADWDVAVTADDTNESLKIEVTGDGANPTQWAVRMDGVETHF